MKKHRLLLITTFIISGCSLCYELIISAVSAYITGNAVLQYSVMIGLYMSAMGLGSFLSRYVRTELFTVFVTVEIGIGVLGGFSSVSIFLANLYIVNYHIIMYAITIGIGILVGMEIPLLTRIIEKSHSNLRMTLSAVFSFDYIGSLVGALAFPLLMVPYGGYLAAAFVCGVLNSVAALLIIWKYTDYIRYSWIYKILTVGVGTAMLLGIIFSGNISHYIEDGLYRDTVIYSEQTPYQKLVLTRHKDDIRLFIDGSLQFSSIDEYRYHEALVHIPLAQIDAIQNVLVLGGGDGVATRELLKYPNVQITVVDLDERMTAMAINHPVLRALNKDAFSNPRVTVINKDAYEFMKENKKQYDAIIIDLPDPNNEALSKLYSNVFYRLCYAALSEKGILVTQSTSPYYAAKTFWSINKTLTSEGFVVYPYHLLVPTFGEWGFNMATKHALHKIHPVNKVDTQFVTPDNIDSLFVFGKDEIPSEPITINQLLHPVIIDYYNEAVRQWH